MTESHEVPSFRLCWIQEGVEWWPPSNQPQGEAVLAERARCARLVERLLAHPPELPLFVRLTMGPMVEQGLKLREEELRRLAEEIRRGEEA